MQLKYMNAELVAVVSSNKNRWSSWLVCVASNKIQMIYQEAQRSHGAPGLALIARFCIHPNACETFKTLETHFPFYSNFFFFM